MNNLKKLLALLLALVTVVSIMAGCGGNSDGTQATDGAEATGSADATGDASGEIPEGQQGVGATGVGNYGGHLNVRTAGRPTGIDPLKQTGAWKYLIMTAVYEPFLTRDADNNIQPGVCDYVLSDDLLDLKIWPREGYVFSRGYGQVEMDDLVASWNRGLTQYANIKKYVKPYVAKAEVEYDEELGHDVFHIVFSEYREKCLYYFAAYRTWWPVMPKEICEKYASSYIIDQLEDAVGTGPYIFTDFQDSIQTTITKRDDYVPVDNSGKSGFAGTKYGYMDSITFWYNSNDASAALAILSGDYDMTEVVPTEYQAMAEAQGITLTKLPSDQRTWVFFNTMGTNNLCAKYPSLRKAVMAAIDYEPFLDVITDGSQIFEGDNAHTILEPIYATDAFTKQDYYGAASQEIVDKYLAQAAEEGYSGEPLQVVYHSGRTDIPTMLCDALENYNINYKLSTMEATTYNAFIGDPSNNWDFYYSWSVTAHTPSLLQDSIIQNNVKSELKDQLLDDMYSMDPTSDEYMAKWNELANHLAEECFFGYMSAIEWWWWHPNTLHINDDGIARYVYNTYWDDPENHPMKQ